MFLLNDFAYWCQQLIAESLVKNGKGILPVVSPAPKDHHSLLQLYLDGQKDKLFIFLSFEDKTKHKISVKKFIDKKHFLEGKNVLFLKLQITQFFYTNHAFEVLTGRNKLKISTYFGKNIMLKLL